AAFVFVYAAYGLNYICSVFMSPDTAQMMAVGGPRRAFNALPRPSPATVRKRAAVQLHRDQQQVIWNNMLLVGGLAIFCICAPAKAPQQELMHPLLALFLLLLTQANGKFAKSGLGIYFRAIALLCMVITSRLKASGGGT
ncbi:hypothetical protein AK812_SmicGene45254, partial [Symbiodinium microadriaticum]